MFSPSIKISLPPYVGRSQVSFTIFGPSWTLFAKCRFETFAINFVSTPARSQSKNQFLEDLVSADLGAAPTYLDELSEQSIG